MSALITGQLDLLALLEEQSAPAPEVVGDEDVSVFSVVEDWARSLGIKVRPLRANDSQSVYSHKRGPSAEGASRPDPDDGFTPHFSGYPIPPHSTQTVAEAIAYYVPRIEADPEFEGLPISGDDVARWGWFQGEHGWLCSPRFRDIWPVLYGSEPPRTRSSESHGSHCKVTHFSPKSYIIATS